MSFESCGKCYQGYIFDELKNIARKCNCLKEYQDQGLINLAIQKSNIPFWISENKLLIDYSFDDYVGNDSNNNLIKLKKFINNFDEKYSKRNLFFSGEPGTQKSTLARFVGVELIKRGKFVYYELADSLIRGLIEADRNDQVKDKWNKIINCDCLIIDELSQDKITTYRSGWQNTFLLPFLKKRIEFIRKSVIFISNSPIENIGTYFKGAVQDLIYREVADKKMIFTDSYEIEQTKFDWNSLWD
jgi:DNA replication protein DnaC